MTPLERAVTTTSSNCAIALEGRNAAVVEIAADMAAVSGRVANALWRSLSGVKLLMGSLLFYEPGKGSGSDVYKVCGASD